MKLAARQLAIVGAMATFFLGLVWFLREIYIATVNLRIGPPGGGRQAE